MFSSVKHQDVLPNDWQNFLCPFQKRSHHFGKMVYSHDPLEVYLVLPFFSVSTFELSFLSQLAFFILQHLIPPHARNFCQSAGGVLHPVSDVVRYEVRHKSLHCIFTSLSMLLQKFPGPVKPIVQLYACSYCRDLRCHMEVSQSLLKKPVLSCKWTQNIWVIILYISAENHQSNGRLSLLCWISQRCSRPKVTASQFPSWYH